MNGQVWVLITSLAGVMIGGGLTFASQWINQRAEAHRHTSAVSEARRAERLNHVITFIKGAQEAERIAIRRHHHGMQGEEADRRADANIDEMWTNVRAVQILCPDNVGLAAREYAGAIHRVMMQGPDTSDVSTLLRADRRSFLETAKRHLQAP